MSNAFDKAIYRAMVEQFNEERRADFEFLGDGGRYTDRQIAYAFELINENGIRATARILKIPRRTLQRWCRQHGVFVKRCPSWVYEWVERRKKRRLFWQRRGYF